MKDYENAAMYFDSAIALNPELWRSYIGRGGVWADKGDFRRALDIMTIAVRLSADNAEALGSRGEIYRRAREFAPARQDLDRAISLDSTVWWLYDERAKLARAHGNLEEADRDFTRALAVAGVSAVCRSNLYNERGRIRYAMYERDPQRRRNWLAAASADFTAALEITPDARSARSNRALTYKDLGLLRRAYSDYSRRIAADPDDYATRLGRGRLLMENLSRPGQAIADFDVAVRAQPQKPDAYFYRGLAHLQAGAEREAARDFEQVLQRTHETGWTKPATYWLRRARESGEVMRLTERT